MASTLILYYSYTGSSQKLAEKLAAERQAELCAVRDKKRPGAFRAYTAGCFAAMRMAAWEVATIDTNPATFDTIVLIAPVWAGHPAPQINSVLNNLPAGKTVEVYMVSASGNSSCKDKVASLVEGKNCQLALFQDVAAKSIYTDNQRK